MKADGATQLTRRSNRLLHFGLQHPAEARKGADRWHRTQEALKQEAARGEEERADEGGGGGALMCFAFFA